MDTTYALDTSLNARFKRIEPTLNEQTRRRFVAEEALRIGPGGIAEVIRQTGVSRSTIDRGILEITSGIPASPFRIRREGGGRKPVTTRFPNLLGQLRAIVGPHLRGNPEKSTVHVALGSHKIAAELLRLHGVKVSHTTVRELLVNELELTLQSQHKAAEGRQHPDRDAQFRHIGAEVRKAAAEGGPVLSVDTKKRAARPEAQQGRRLVLQGEAAAG